MTFDVDNVKFDERGLVPVVVQNALTLEVLTLAYMNAESLQRTVATNETWFWSRSRNQLWHKGETSGNTQRVVEIKLDCDADALVVLVEPNGPACHTGSRSCFGESSAHAPEDEDLLAVLYQLILERKSKRPENSYTTYLFDSGLDKILKKVGEEATETIIAAKNQSSAPLVAEVSDLTYHLLVLLVERGVSLAQVKAELARRFKKQ